MFKNVCFFQESSWQRNDVFQQKNERFCLKHALWKTRCFIVSLYYGSISNADSLNCNELFIGWNRYIRESTSTQQAFDQIKLRHLYYIVCHRCFHCIAFSYFTLPKGNFEFLPKVLLSGLLKNPLLLHPASAVVAFSSWLFSSSLVFVSSTPPPPASPSEEAVL